MTEGPCLAFYLFFSLRALLLGLATLGCKRHPCSGNVFLRVHEPPLPSHLPSHLPSPIKQMGSGGNQNFDFADGLESVQEVISTVTNPPVPCNKMPRL